MNLESKLNTENKGISVSDVIKERANTYGFTDDQKKAYFGLIEFINSSYNPNDYKRALIGAGGTGKALVNGTPVLTNKGWKAIETLKIGDLVATPYHGFAKVSGVYPQGLKHEIYSVWFSDNRNIQCDENHLWLVRTKKLMAKYRCTKGENTRYSKVLTTKEMFDNSVSKPLKLDGSQGYRYFIPVHEVYNDEKELPINPYVLGVLLGDGCLTTNVAKGDSRVLYISSDEEDIISKVSNILNCKYKWHKDYNYTNVIYGDNIISIHKELKALNLECTAIHKYIPEIYLLSSIEQRKELLKGLIDTDGYIDSKGRYRYSTSSFNLAKDFITLCRSLGYIVSDYYKDTRGKHINYVISIQTNDIIFSSNWRKQEYDKIKVKHTFYNDHVAITNIVKKKVEVETTCISIDDTDKLFITKDYIVTHNTFVLKAVLQNCNINYSKIGLSAPSHKACRVLRNAISGTSCKVNTIQSDFGFKPNYDLEKFDINNIQFSSYGRIKVEDYSLYIVDEASMISKDLLKYIERIMKQYRIKLILCGDDHQIPAINEHECAAFKAIQSFKLNKIVRQDEDNPIRELTNLLRSDIENNTFNFLNYIGRVSSKFDSTMTKGFVVCNSLTFRQEVLKQFSDESITRNTDYVKVISYTNKNVSAWNKFIRESIIKDANKSIITKNDLITSYTTIVDKFNDEIIRNSEDYIVKEIANYTHPQYNLKGFMVKFQAVFGGQITSPLFIIDHTDPYTMQMYCKLANELVQSARNARKDMRAKRWKEYYAFKESCLLLANIGIPGTDKILYYRDLDYGFSISSHKSQGSTYNVSMVDVMDIVYDKYGRPYTDAKDINKRLYVAVSRAKEKVYLRYGY